jgi:hypothetical protein
LQSKPQGMPIGCRLMAEAQGVSKNTVNRLWQLHNIKPHLSRTFKLSRDAKFLEKLTHVVGYYLKPPDKALVALVLCVDGKVIGECYGRHRHQERRKFLRHLDAEFPRSWAVSIRGFNGTSRTSTAGGNLGDLHAWNHAEEIRECWQRRSVGCLLG